MALSARKLSARRGRFVLTVDDLRADASGTALLGRNGAGKSTLLLALQGIVEHRGTVERPAHCAGVFAQPAVLRGSVLWNVEAIARRRARQTLADVGLGAALHLDARRLSSGERQRLALARALALEPQALFLDEPFSNVDADGRPGLRRVVREYVAASGCALLLATQSLADVVALCKTIVVLENGTLVDTLDVLETGASRNGYVQALVAESRLR